MAESNKLVIRKIVVGRPISTALSSGTLASMSDVSINGKQNGQGIFYNTAANRWENGTFTAGEGIDISWDSSANTLTFIAEYADSDNAGVAKFTSSDFSVDSVGKVDIKFNSLPESLIPASDSAYDLGSASKKWRSLYLSAGTIYLGDNKAISLDSSSGTLLFDGQSVLIAGSSASDSDIRNLFTASGGLSYNSSTGAFTDSDRTRSQILNLINVTGGGLSYNAATGTITDSDRSTSQIKGLFTASGGGLSYNSSTGAFTDSDRSRAQILGLHTGSTGITYSDSTGAISITNTGVAAATYGSATAIPVLTINAQGQIDSAGTIGVSGITGVSFDSATGILTVATSGDNYTSGITKPLKVGGSLSYDSATAVLTYTDSDRSRAQILGLHTGGTGITYNNSTGAISLTGDSNTFSGLTVTNNLTVSGNLVVAGTRTEVNTATLSVEDNIITLNSNVTGTPNTNAGIEVNRGNQNTKSIQWNETADKWYVESDGNGTFVTGLLETDSATIGGHPILTDNDGAFIKGLLSGSTGITYSDSTGAISITNTGVASATYGSSTAIPVFTVNAQGQIDSAGVVDVAGVNSASWDSASNRYRIALATGDNIDTTIGGFNNISFKSLSDSAQTVIRSQLNVVGSLSYDSATGQLSYTDSDRSAASIKGLFTASGGGLSYNNSTGAFTDSDRSAASIKGLFTASGGGLSYNNSTGVFTDSDRSRAQILGLHTGTSGVTYNNTTGVISIGQPVGTDDSVTFSGLYVSGDFKVGGTTTTISTSNLIVEDPLIHLANANEVSDVVDIGFVGHYYRNAQRRHTGFFRDASNQQYYLFNNLIDSGMDSTAPPSVINRAATDYDDASLNVGKLIAADSVTSGGNAVLTVAKTSWIRNLFSATGGGLSYNSSTGVFTDSDRSAASIKGLFSASGGGLSYNSSTGVITDSDRTSAQIKGLFTVTGGGLSYNSSTGVITDSDRTANQIKELFTGGTGITFDSGAISLTGDSNTFSGLTVTNNLTVKGNLIVAGTRTEVNTAVLNIEDNIITLNSGTTGTPSENAGILVDRGNLISKSIQWNEGADKWYIESDGNGSLMTGLLEADSATIGGHPILTDNDGAFIKGLFSATGGGLSYNNSTGVFTDSDRSRAQILGMIQAGNGLNWSADSGLMTLSGHAYERYEYSATAGQVTFVDSDVAGNVLSYNTLASFITLNGVILDPSDYTASNGTSVVLASGTDSADILGVYAFNVNGVSDTVSATNGGTFQSNLVVSGSLTATTLVGAGTGITSLNGAVVMNAIKAVDSNGSGLNADTLDGQQGAYYRINVYNAAGTLLN
jgi:hypothetical protein